jgi:hypothetical protein
MSPRFRVPRKWTIFGLFALILPVTIPAQTLSQSRMLRLSFVQGNVTLQRPDLQGWAQAPVNTPLAQGFQLSTGDNSFAEIQFENGSAIRLGEQSTIALLELAQTADGNKVDQVELRQGYATFHPISPATRESLQVLTPQGKLSASSDAEFRVDIDQGMERVEVFTGMVDADSNLGSVALQADSVLVFQPGARDPAEVSQGITEDDWDRWVADREIQVSSDGPSPSSYTDEPYEVPFGWDDLSQNGSWIDVESLGYGWSPNVPAGWSPYSSGQWCWYQGVGYTWIGSEPWGWLPYHYGGWEFVPGHGWVWLPERIKSWSPARVNWYQGPGWVGWRPKGSDRNSRADCGNTCGGGIVTTGAFRQGGSVSPQTMLRVSLPPGSSVTKLDVAPSSSASLPGAPQTFSAAEQGHGTWSFSRSQMGPWSSAPSANPPNATRSGRAGATNPGIIYDPNAGSFVNRQRSTLSVGPSAYPRGAMRPVTISPQAPNPLQSPSAAPSVTPPNGGQAPLEPVQGVFASPAPLRPVTSNPAPHSNPVYGRGASSSPPASGFSRSGGASAGGQGGSSHSPAWAPASGGGSASSAAGGHH